MAQVIWVNPALNDLNTIAEYIALDKPEAAKKLVQEVFRKVERLRTFPNSGKKPEELGKNTAYKEIVVNPCRIFYRLEKERVIILHVQRGEREMRAWLLGKRESNR